MNEITQQDLLELLETFERKPYESTFTETVGYVVFFFSLKNIIQHTPEKPFHS